MSLNFPVTSASRATGIVLGYLPEDYHQEKIAPLVYSCMLSNVEREDFAPAQQALPITAEIVQKCVNFVLANAEKLKSCQSDAELHFYNGKHCVVFSHIAFPGLVLKIMTCAQALDSKSSLDHARLLFSEQFRYCYAPQAEIAALPEGRSLFIMEKAQGVVDEWTAKEMMEEQFTLIDSNPLVAEQWEAQTREVAQATELLGYWDSQRKNFVWDPETGVWSFIDFERVFPSISNRDTGLGRLVEIFPPQYVDRIYAAAERGGIELKPEMNTAQAARQSKFDFSCSRKLWNQQKSVPRIFNERERSKEETNILDRFKEARGYYGTDYPPGQVQLFCQPLSSIFSNRWEMRGTPEGLELVQKSRMDFEEALKSLQAAGDVHTWQIDEAFFQKELVSYTIYF